MAAESTKGDGKPRTGKAAPEISGIEAVPGKNRRTEFRGAMETSASFEARYAPLSYPTVEAHVRICAGAVSDDRLYRNSQMTLEPRVSV
jgi:hypothetical protein